MRLSKRFQRVTAVRNFYCHANYKASLSTLELGAVEGDQLTRDETVLSIIAKPSDATLVAQLRTAIDNCVVLNREAWGLLVTPQKQLNAKFPTLPALPAGYATPPKFLREAGA